MGSAISCNSNTKVTQTQNEETMSDEDLDKFRNQKFDHFRETAREVVALEIRHEQYREFVSQIYNAGVIFYKGYWALKKTKTVRANVEQFRRDIAQIMIESRYFSLCCEFVMHTYKLGWHLEDNNVYQTVLVIYMIVLQNFGDASDEMAIALANEPGCIEIFKLMIEDFLAKYFSEEQNFKMTETEEKMLDSALGTIHNMTMRESNISKLRDAGMIESLKPYLKSSNNDHALVTLTCLAGIINEKECDIINSNKQIVEYLLECMRKGMKDKMRVWRCWPSKECAFTVKLLARNDANIKILVELGALELLVELGRIGDEDEQYESVSALWALCFDEENQTLITGKQELGIVDLLVDLKSSKNEKIKKACNGALWTLRDALKKTVVKKYKKIGEQFSADKDKTETHGEEKKQVTSADKVSSKGHVMISYQWADQQILKNVRDNIKARGYRVWMDIDQMGGSTLQAMADAVEGADVFLMCMSNKYKHSPSCRAEAEYAFQLRKYIIPLKMERCYTPDGWLGFIVGAKLYFEFSPKYPFEDKMKALLKEINSVLVKTGDMHDSGEIIAPQIASVTEGISVQTVSHADTASALSNSGTVNKASKWTDDDVKRWIEQNGLQKCGINSLTGGEIALLASARTECPEFFYKCLEDKLNIKDLLTISKVFLALHDVS